jgi:hypothetical protein
MGTSGEETGTPGEEIEAPGTTGCDAEPDG